MAKSKSNENEDHDDKKKNTNKDEKKTDSKKPNTLEKSDSKQNHGSRLYIENIDVSNRELEKLFSKFGPILEAWSVRSNPRYAFVLFKHKDDASEALENMND